MPYFGLCIDPVVTHKTIMLPLIFPSMIECCKNRNDILINKEIRLIVIDIRQNKITKLIIFLMWQHSLNLLTCYLIHYYVSGSWNQGDVFRLSRSEAIWNGEDFDIDVRSYAIEEIIG